MCNFYRYSLGLCFVLVMFQSVSEGQVSSQHSADSTGMAIQVKTKRAYDAREFVFVVLKDGKELYSASPDFGGHLVITQLIAGAYTLRVMYHDSLLKEITDVQVVNGKLNGLRVKLKMDLPKYPNFTVCPKIYNPPKDYRWLLLNGEF